MNSVPKVLTFPHPDGSQAPFTESFAPTVLHPDGTAGIGWTARMLRIPEREVLGLALDGEILVARYCFDSIKLAIGVKGIREREAILDYLMDVDNLRRNNIVLSFDRQSVKDYYLKNISNNSKVNRALGTEILQNTQVILEKMDEVLEGMVEIKECCAGLKKLKEEVADIKKKLP